MGSPEANPSGRDAITDMRAASESALNGLAACLAATHLAIEADDDRLRSTAQGIRNSLYEGFIDFDHKFLGTLARHIHGEPPIVPDNPSNK